MLNGRNGNIFLATPRRGSSVASLGNILSQIVQAAKLGAPRTESVSELTEFSNTVQDINSDFVHLSPLFSITSFYETLGYMGIGTVRTMKSCHAVEY